MDYRRSGLEGVEHDNELVARPSLEVIIGPDDRS
jgi:hypothetical protein